MKVSVVENKKNKQMVLIMTGIGKDNDIPSYIPPDCFLLLVSASLCKERKNKFCWAKEELLMMPPEVKRWYLPPRPHNFYCISYKASADAYLKATLKTLDSY